MQYDGAANPYNPYARNKQAQDLRGRSNSYGYPNDTPPRTGSTEINMVGWSAMAASAQTKVVTGFGDNNAVRRPSQPVPAHRNDVVARHLLVETALLDSQNFELLTIEEVDSLKREKIQLDGRLEAARRKLALESKVRDAAQSLRRLYADDIKAPTSPASRPRASILGERGRSNSSASVNNTLGQANDELEASQKKIDDLLQILAGLESRRQYVESRLLRHTSAVLQMAHEELQQTKSPLAENGDDDMGRNLVDDTIRGLSNGGFEESIYIKRSPGLLNGFSNGGRQQPALSQVSKETLASLQSRIDGMNNQMRNLIQLVRGESSVANDDDPRPPSRSGEDAIAYLDTQVGLVDKNVVRLEQECLKVRDERESAQGQLARINNQLFLLLQSSTSDGLPGSVPPPPATGPGSAQSQLEYLEDNLGTVEIAMQARTGDAEKQILEAKRQNQQYEATMEELWAKMGPSEGGTEPFSLQGFSTRIQLINDRAARMDTQADILRRQVQQQRELNSKSESAKDQQLGQLQVARDELEQELVALRQKHVVVEAESKGARSEIDNIMREIEQIRITAKSQEEQKQSVLEQLKKQTSRNNDLEIRVADYEERMADMHDSSRALKMESDTKSKAHETKLTSLTGELAEARSAYLAASSKMEEKHREAETLETEVVRLTTELTMVKADLDAAYGSRAERAKEQATVELAEMRKTRAADQERMQTLEKELSGVAQDLQELTRESVDAERERDQLEVLVDGLRERCETLETQLGDEKVRWMGMASPMSMATDGGREMTSAAVLRTEFKRMMRETRDEHAKQLRGEQEERKKLETMVRDMKRDRTGKK